MENSSGTITIDASLTTYFTVMPKDCNYMYPIIFGGEFMAQMDLAAAMVVRRALHLSRCNKAVTHKVLDIEFKAAAESGDTLQLVATIVEVRNNSLRVLVEAYREKLPEVDLQQTPTSDFIASGSFVFVTKKDNSFAPHRLRLENGKVCAIIQK